MIIDNDALIYWSFRIVFGSSMLLGLGLLAVFLTPLRMATQRHLMGLIACIALLLLPVFAYLVPGIDILTSQPLIQELCYDNAAVSRTLGAQGAEAHLAETQPLLSNSTNERATHPTPIRDSGSAPRADILPVTESVNLPTNETTSRAGHVLRPLVVIAFAVYAAGVAILLIKLLLAHIYCFAIRCTSELSDLSLQQRRSLIPRLAKHAKYIRINHSGKLAIPLVTGLWRPLILLPATATTWSTEKLFAVLAHELAHVRRRDLWSQLISKLAQCIYWPNPLIHLLCHQMHRSREIACDQHAVRSDIDSVYYASLLIEIAQEAKHFKHQRTGALAMSQSNLASRVSMVLTQEPSDLNIVLQLSIWRSLLAIILMASILCIDLTASPQLPSPPENSATSEGGNINENHRESMVSTPKQTLTEETQKTLRKDVVPSGVDRPSPPGMPVIHASGKVVDSQGNPVPNAVLSMCEDMEKNVIAKLSPSDAEGHFTAHYSFTGPTFAGLHTWFYAPGHSIRVARMRSPFGFLDTLDKADDLCVPLPPYEETKFQILKPDGSPCEGATLSVSSMMIPNGVFISDELIEHTGLASPPPQDLSPMINGLTDATGLGIIHGIPKQLLSNISVECQDFGVQTFSVSPYIQLNSKITTLQLKGVATIRGVVRFGRAGLLEGTKLYLQTIGPSSANTKWYGQATVTVDNQGRFEAIVAAEDSNLTIKSSPWASDLNAVPVLPKSTRLRTGEIVNLEIQTVPTVTVIGSVRTAEGDLPVSNAVISLGTAGHGVSGASHTTTNNDGVYTAKVAAGSLHQQLIGYLSDGTHTRFYNHPGIPDCEIPSDLDEVHLKPVLVSPMQEIRGILVDPVGKPVGNQSIAITRGSLSPGVRGGGKTSGDGTFSFVISGRYNLKDKPVGRLDKPRWVVMTKPRDGIVPAVYTDLIIVKDDPNDMILQLPE